MMTVLIYLAVALVVVFLVMLFVCAWNEWNLTSREECRLNIDKCLADKDYVKAQIYIKKAKRLQSLFIRFG